MRVCLPLSLCRQRRVSRGFVVPRLPPHRSSFCPTAIRRDSQAKSPCRRWLGSGPLQRLRARPPTPLTGRVSLLPDGAREPELCVCRGSARASVRQAHVSSRPPRFPLFLSALSLLRTRRREGVSAGDVTLARSHSRRPARGHRRVSETQAHGRLSQPESFLWQQGCEPGLRGRAGGRPVAPRTPLSGFPHRRPPLHAPRPPPRHRRLLRTAPCPDDRSRPSVTRVLQ